ncbi:MAG: hypothetical protein DSY47_07255 [Hydrogenothermus sp.]|nr:MAG: hypothetical protein DSY47_07255 [Hydrogenothermus sp.]
MATLKIDLDEKVLEILNKLSKENQKTKEEIIKEIIENSLQERIIDKSREIIKEEKILLKRLA